MIRPLSPFVILCTFVVAFAFAACRQEESIPLDVPDGWHANGPRWWYENTDTTHAFRDLETLRSMNIKSAKTAGYEIGTGEWIEEEARNRLVTYVKNSLIPLFRHQPQIVDSLFERFIVKKMANARLRGDVRPVIIKYKKEAYRVISRHFRQPYSITKLGVDVPLLFPDSLRIQNVHGEVFLQIHISDEGLPVAIELLSGIHPVLDRIAIRAMTQMRWQPAYVVDGLKSPAIASWARYTVRFAPPDSR